MRIKIDIDYRNFHKWILHFKVMYWVLRYGGVIFNYGVVYKTKKGFHVYLDQDKTLSKNEINLIECFLGSDLFKQGYSWVEQRDVLFRIKNGIVNEHLDRTRTRKLNAAIDKINGRKFKMVSIVIPTTKVKRNGKKNIK